MSNYLQARPMFETHEIILSKQYRMPFRGGGASGEAVVPGYQFSPVQSARRNSTQLNSTGNWVELS